MKSPVRIALFVMFATMLILTACGAPATPAPDYAVDNAPAAMEATAAPMQEPAAAAPAIDQGKASADASGAGGNAIVASSGIDASGTTIPDVQQPQSDRKIIKNADLKLQVQDTDNAINGVSQVVGDVGGYTISSRVWFQDYNNTSYKYATISMGVPVDQFETAMRRLRGLSLKVLDENASGQDVTDQYVDLQSQLDNLTATRDRIRGFLDQAKTVDEALQVNQQLTDVEGQIEQVKGKMNYLSGRSAFSTITVNLEPKLPDISPTPTLTPTPTPTPVVWQPGATAGAATDTLIHAYEGIINVLIWVFVVLLPLLLPPALIIWLLWKFATRKPNKPASGG